MRLGSSSRVSSHPLNMSFAIGFRRESNLSHMICHLHAVPLGYVADNFAPCNSLSLHKTVLEAFGS